MTDRPMHEGGDPTRPDRLAELLGGAAAGDLDDAETRELDLLLADPSAHDTLEGHRAVTARLGGSPGLDWQEASLSGEATGRVRDRIRQERRGGGRPPARALLAAAAACLVLGGLVGGIVGHRIGSDSPDRPAVVTGPPGTLGAYERLTFDQRPRDVDVRASVVAHTWGTEAVLDVSGLDEGRRYTVELILDDGSTRVTGSFTATPEVSNCRTIDAVMRSDVRGLAIVDRSGADVLHADLPAVDAE